MKLFRYITVIASLAAIFSCSGTVDDSSLPVLEVSDAEIDIANETEAVFTVTYNGVDVTADSQIVSTADGLAGNVYTPAVEGTAVFHAVYKGLNSNQVTVHVVNSDVKVESKYDRHVSVIEFTGAWCVNCPEGYDKMMGTLSKPSLAKFKENIHICAFHSNLEGHDELAIPQTQDVFGLFESLAYPSFATDLRDSGVLTAEGIGLFQPSLMASFNEYTPHCGVAVSSVVDGNNASVTVDVDSEKTDEYRVLVLIVEDGIKASQKSPNFPDGQDDYIHRHVVRKVVTSYSGTFTGERITSDGYIPAGETASKTWIVGVDSGWNLDKTEIYALALDRNGYVNNMNLCPIDGGDSGFDFK